MKLQKQDCGVWVNSKDELPNDEGIYYVRNGEMRYLAIFDKSISFGIRYDIEWLKLVKYVYVLTEDQLKQLLVDYEDYSFRKVVELPWSLQKESLEIAETFIQHLTEK